MDSIRITLKGNNTTVPGGDVTLSIYSGLGGAGVAGNTLVGVATISAASLANAYALYDVKFAGNALLNLGAGGYSMTMSVPSGVVVKTTSYLFKSGPADVVDANGATLSSSLLWIQDANSAGTAQAFSPPPRRSRSSPTPVSPRAPWPSGTIA